MSESQKRDAEEAGGGSSASSKRLKSSEPDLSIICQHGATKETLLYHSQIMAKHSNYFDTLLASGMQESESKTVALDDVDPDAFQKAIEILEDPKSILTASAEDMLAAGPIYNRFEFSKGLELAETLLGKFLDEWTEQKEKLPTPWELARIGDAILFSQEAHLEHLIQKSVSFIKAKLDKSSMKSLMIFQESFIQKIEPFLDEHKEATLTDFLGKIGPKTTKAILTCPDLMTNLRLKCALQVSMSQMRRLNVRYLASIHLPPASQASGISLFLQVRPYQKVTTQLDQRLVPRLNNQLEVHCKLSPLIVAGNVSFESWTKSKYGEPGDWSATVEVVGTERETYRFVWPFSKTLPLPPIETPCLYVRNEEQDDESDPTFELRPDSHGHG